MNGKNFSFALLFLVLCFTRSKAQDDLPGYDHYTVKNGLPTQTIYNVLQDRNGFLWIATDAGVSRFDGKNFVNYTTENGLGDNEILSLYEDRKGRIWFVPLSVRQSYYLDGKFYTDKNDSLMKELAGYGVVYGAVETASGDMYMQVRERPHSVLKIDKNNKVTCFNFSHLLGAADAIRILHISSDNNKVHGITDAEKMLLISGPVPGEIKNPYPSFSEGGMKTWGANYTDPSRTLFANSNGIYIINDTAASLLLPIQQIPFGKTSDIIMLMDKYRNIWVCNYRHNTFFFRYVNNGYAPAVHVHKDMFAIVAVDKEDNVWFCTGNKGLYKIPYKKLLEDIMPGFKNQLLQKNILCMNTDAEGTLWMGYSNGYVSRVKGTEVKHFNLNFGALNYNRILQIQPDAEGDIWCGTDETCVLLKKEGQGAYTPIQLKYKTGKNYYSSVKKIVFDKTGNLHITAPREICKVSKKQIIAQREYFTKNNLRIYSGFFDRQNTFYVSNIEGLHILEGGTLKSLVATEPRLKARIQHFSQHTDGTIFLATYSDGILALQNNKVVASLGRADGLAGIICRRVYLKNDTLYIVTNGGITIATYRAGKFAIVQHIGLADGLHSIDVNDIAFSGNTLCVATSEGLSTLSLPLQTQYPVPPPVLSILTFKVNETVFPFTSSITFPYRQQSVRIEYIAPVMANPEAVKYRYRFAGSNEWRTTSATQLEFNDLHHGDFRIEIQARKLNSDWSESKEIIFTILPPFYSTWTFRIQMGLCVVFGLYILLRYRLTKRFRAQLAQVKQNEAVEKERNRIASDIHDDIGAELTHIVLLSRILKENSPHTVRFTDMVDKLEKSSNEVINKMNEVIWTLNAANHTLHSLAAYLHNYSARLLEEHGLKNNITIDESVFTDHLVKADVSRNIFLIIKETLHNIIKHSGADRVDIYFILLQGPVLFVEIKDNGKGFDTLHAATGNGLNNIQKRATILQGKAEIETQPGAGCILRVNIPL